MKRFQAVPLALAAGALFAVAATDADAGPGRGGSSKASAELAPPVGGGIETATGKVEGRTHAARGQEVLTILANGLRPGGRYSVLIDDPSTAEPAAVRVRSARAKGRRLVARFGNRRLPHGATLETLAGARVEIRDSRGLLVLSGEVPSFRQGEGCILTETEVFTDTFDTELVGGAPSLWTVTGTSVTVDNLVADGGTGASALIADSEAVDTGAPEMTRTFTAQDRLFAAEFLLVPANLTSRVVMNLGQTTDTGVVVPTGFGSGVGLYEDGTIGFGIGDTIGTATAATPVRIRVDVDLVTRTFDVSLDGVQAVNDRPLGFDGASIDRITFSGSPLTTGTANVDTVRVLHIEENCPPIANAGPDQIVECVGGAITPATLDGSLSSDPEGATLTYTWTGDFVEGTATGPNPTVTFTGVGSHTVTLEVSDGVLTATDTVAIEIQGVPAQLTITGLPSTVWPPNHNLLNVQPTIVAADGCTFVGVDAVTLVITSNEEDNGTGDGNTTGDIVIRNAGDFDLRAERSGRGTGRTYHLVWSLTAIDGTVLTYEADIVIPHDRRGGGAFTPAPDGPDMGAANGGTKKHKNRGRRGRR